jgi:transaldolase/glucose-6-phosphate isomerase
MSTETSANVNPKLKALTDAGVSVWLDQIRRSLVEGGELARMVAEDSLRGLTSNPSIFEKAILGSSDYDDDLRAMAHEDLDARTIFERLAIHDLRGAADVLSSVYESTGGRDGFVSMEVMPEMAHKTEETLSSARTYWEQLDRPNAMIKIPGTPEGVPAIEQATYEGINVNVTLLFSVAAYEDVVEAYIRGLERRLEEGKPVDHLNSVASFFVSRVDTAVDRKLTELGRDDLAGTAAIANARDAYARFEKRFSGERWEKLRAAGAAVQRPLWASTGVKNPNYSDTMYVDELVGPHTVNTMPMATLLAVGEHSELNDGSASIDASEALAALADAGIDLGDVTDQLLVDGVKQFEDAIDRLLGGIDERRAAVLMGTPPTIQVKLPAELREPVAAREKQAVSERVAARIWRRDESLWGGPGVPEISNRLGWLTVSDSMLEHSSQLHAFAAKAREDGFTDAVLLGMGGSSLGPEVIRRSFGEIPDGLRLQVLDSTHPDVVLAVKESIDLKKTLFIVSSKSGGTIETLSHYRYFSSMAEPHQFAVVTDPGSPLEQLGKDDGVRQVFLNPPDIGGRYSVLSLFGLLPAALMGVGIEALLHSSQVGEQTSAHYDSSESNAGLWLGSALGELARHGRDKLTFVVSKPIESFGLWVEQLIAESTGKQGRGILPVADEPLAEHPSVYGDDRVFVYLRNEDEPDEKLDEFVEGVADAGHPAITVATHDASDLGRIFFLAEFAVAVAGWAIEINPFDQPNVQEAKDNTKKVLDAIPAHPIPTFDDASDEALKALLGADAKPPAYVAILGYLPPSDALDEAVSGLRAAIRAATGAAVTFGYGPRFQHSTGQLHKGGPPVGRFLQLVNQPSRDADIPGADYSFGTLIAAQSAGDLQTLHAHELAAERVTLQGDPAEAVKQLTERITGLLKG